jgi:preprotein translocase subunit SecG
MSEQKRTPFLVIVSWILAIVFMVLKLCKVIDWHWVWVFSPLWIRYAIFLVCNIILLFLNRIEKHERS